MECRVCGYDTKSLSPLCERHSTIRRHDGVFVGKVDIVNGNLVFTTRREKKHIFIKYGKLGGFGLSAHPPISDLLHIKEKLHKDDVLIVIKFGKTVGYGFRESKTYKTTLMTFLKEGIVPPLTETDGDKQYILPIERMERRGVSPAQPSRAGTY